MSVQTGGESGRRGGGKILKAKRVKALRGGDMDSEGVKNVVCSGNVIDTRGHGRSKGKKGDE